MVENEIERVNKPFDHINLLGIMCSNGCKDQSFTIFFKRRSETTNRELLFRVRCNTCGEVISELYSKC
jgi:hypothetical protein